MFRWLRRLFVLPGPDPSGVQPSTEPETEVTGETIEVPITDTIDLHPFAPREIRDVAISFLEAAHEEGLRELRLIHGRGTGTQRRLVRGALEKHPLVASFADDPGNWGATQVRLLDAPAETTSRQQAADPCRRTAPDDGSDS